MLIKGRIRILFALMSLKYIKTFNKNIVPNFPGFVSVPHLYTTTAFYLSLHPYIMVIGLSGVQLCM